MPKRKQEEATEDKLTRRVTRGRQSVQAVAEKAAPGIGLDEVQAPKACAGKFTAADRRQQRGARRRQQQQRQQQQPEQEQIVLSSDSDGGGSQQAAATIGAPQLAAPPPLPLPPLQGPVDCSDKEESSDVLEVVDGALQGSAEDWELQQALELSLREYQASPAGRAAGLGRRQQQRQREALLEGQEDEKEGEEEQKGQGISRHQQQQRQREKDQQQQLSKQQQQQQHKEQQTGAGIKAVPPLLQRQQKEQRMAGIEAGQQPVGASQQVAPAAKRAAKQPMRGKRGWVAALPAVNEEDGQTREPGDQQQQQQQEHHQQQPVSPQRQQQAPPPAGVGPATDAQQQLQQGPPPPTLPLTQQQWGNQQQLQQQQRGQQGQQPQQQQQLQRGQQRGQRRKKLPAFDPSPAEVDACFAQLAEAEAEGVCGTVTVGSIMQVGHALGQELEQHAVHNMMQMAADHVLGWSSGAGRGRGAGGRLNLAEFRRLVEHFRVAAE